MPSTPRHDCCAGLHKSRLTLPARLGRERLSVQRPCGSTERLRHGIYKGDSACPRHHPKAPPPFLRVPVSRATAASRHAISRSAGFLPSVSQVAGVRCSGKTDHCCQEALGRWCGALQPTVVRNRLSTAKRRVRSVAPIDKSEKTSLLCLSPLLCVGGPRPSPRPFCSVSKRCKWLARSRALL